MILLPIKDLRKVKQRLADVLDQGSRTQLAQAMIRDILSTLASWQNCPEVALVSSDPFAADLAAQYKFQVIADLENRSETDAIEKATSFCVSQGIKSTLVIPADIPLVTSYELDQVMVEAPSEGTVLVPAADGRGTNAVLRTPAALFPLRFGNDSFKPHCAAARATGLPCTILSLPGIALDIDSPHDLQQLAAAPGDTRSQRLARQWDLTEYPIAANE